MEPDAEAEGDGASAESTQTQTTSTDDDRPVHRDNGDTGSAPGPTVVRVTVVNGLPKGGIKRAKIDQGARVVLVVTSDVADEVHVHGYDVSRPVAAGETVRLRFRATLPGRFEVELEERGVQIAALSVEP